MALITLDNTKFWEWMCYPSGDDLCYARYIEAIADMMIPHSSGHVAYAYHMNNKKASYLLEPPTFMRYLYDSVPIWYYEEIIYCAQAYSILFGALFPRLVEHVDELAYIEWLLFTEPGYRKYRDHLVHMFKVAYVCDKWVMQRRLFNKLADTQLKSKHFQQWVNTKPAIYDAVNDENKRDVIKIALFIAAVFHDFGYSYFFLNQYHKRLHKLNKWLLPGADPIDRNLDATQKILKSLPAEFVRTYHHNSGVGGSEIIEQRVASFFYDNRLLNHSIASSFFIIDLCEKLFELEAISGPLYVAFQLAAEISMIHDMTGDDNWMDFDLKYNDGCKYFHFIDSKVQEQIPISMFFILSDELAVWNRKTMELKHKGYDVVQQKIEPTNESDKIEIYLTYSPKKIVIEASEKMTKYDLRKAMADLRFLKESSNKKIEILGFEIDIH